MLQMIRHSREGGNPCLFRIEHNRNGLSFAHCSNWIPAFAGMTEIRLNHWKMIMSRNFRVEHLSGLTPAVRVKLFSRLANRTL